MTKISMTQTKKKITMSGKNGLANLLKKYSLFIIFSYLIIGIWVLEFVILTH